MQNNTAVHKSRSTKGWLVINEASTLDWPSQFLDLKPTENLYGLKFWGIYGGCNHFHEIEELEKQSRMLRMKVSDKR